jgi:hypothetical protein
MLRPPDRAISPEIQPPPHEPCRSAPARRHSLGTLRPRQVAVPDQRARLRRSPRTRPLLDQKPDHDQRGYRDTSGRSGRSHSARSATSALLASSGSSHPRQAAMRPRGVCSGWRSFGACQHPVSATARPHGGTSPSPVPTAATPTPDRTDVNHLEHVGPNQAELGTISDGSHTDRARP